MNEFDRELDGKELENVAGGKQDKNDYIYETVATVETPFYKAISTTPANYQVWFELCPGVTRIRVREEDIVDWMGNTYVRCIAKVDNIEEGYVLQDHIIRSNVQEI